MIQSYLLIGNDKEKKKTFLQSMQTQHAVDQFDLTILEEEKALGIESVRELQKSLFLKPFKSENKIVFIDAVGITLEAQSAMLKTLEEPPKQTIIVVSVPTIDQILPTILSRCTTIMFDTEKSNKQEAVIDIFQQTLGEKLKHAEIFGKSREEALQFLERLMQQLREEMIANANDKQISQTNSQALEQMLQTYKNIKNTNIQPRFSLENLFLNI